MRLLLLVLVLACALFAASSVVSGNYEAGAFGNGEFPLLFEMHKLTVGEGRQSFVYPSRNLEFRGELCNSCFWKTNGNVSASVWNTGFGGEVFFAGFVDSVDFDIDAKFNWIREPNKSFAEIDGESVHEIWDDGDDWVNYTRYRGHVGYNYAWVRLELGHDAMHWGPGYYNNLTLNRQAVPFNYVSINLTFGPLRVLSFYSKLRIDSANVYTHKNDERNFFGHRYELIFDNLTVGVSEIQLIYNNNNLWLLTPIIPMFIEKGNYEEARNNGALAFDFNYRMFRTARIYGEFFLDDMDSPIAVIENEYMNSEWAWMLGMQVAHDIAAGVNKVQLGTVFEVARIEQLVYSHYDSYQGQLANAGHVLGNPNGPNSLSIDWLVYSRWMRGEHSIYVSLRNSWTWKGNVYGSDFNQSIVAGVSPKIHKNYLGGAKMHYRITPSLAYETTHWGASTELSFGHSDEKNAKAWVRW